MTQHSILLIEPDCNRQHLIVEQGKVLNTPVQIADTLDSFLHELNNFPALILINTDDASGLWQTCLVSKIHRKHHPPIGVLGFSQKKNAVTRLDALDLGCDNVVSQGAIEQNLGLQFSRHARPADLHDLPPILPAGIVEGLELFNRRQFHPAHDAIEPVWLQEKRGIRLLYAGILQVGIAYHFIEHQSYGQALRMFGHGRAKLVPFFSNTLGVEIEDLYQKATDSFYKLKSLGPNKISHFTQDLFPTIQYQMAPPK